MKRLIFAVTPLIILATAFWQPAPAEAQSVLKVARGVQSNDISVFIDRAIVLDSRIEFEELTVANPEIADVQPINTRSIYIFGRRRGTTSLTLLDSNGRLITNILIRVEADHTEMKQRLRELLPREPIEVRTAAGGLVLSGVVSGKAKIDKAMSLARAYAGDAVTNMMTVGGTQQVMLKVKVAEVNRGSGKDLGISLGVQGSTGRIGTNTFTGENIRNATSETTVVAPDGTVTRITNPGTLSGPNRGGTPVLGGFENFFPGAGAFAGSFGAIFSIANSFLLDVQIDALESKGFARTLSEPNLVALSGQSASFLAGGEVPIPVVGDDGDITVEFKNVGVSLDFVPVVVDDDLINISVAAEVSQVDPSISTNTGGVEVVGFQTRRAETVVELRDGQAFAIAGLIQDEFQDSISQVPWIGDIPVIGTLFRSSNFQRGQTELVIFISAHLVTPVGSEDDISLPTDRIAIPNEAEIFLLGSTTGGESAFGAGVGLSGADFDGEYGYVLD